MKKHIMDEAIEDMRKELCQLHGALCKYARGEKYVLLHLLYLSLSLQLLQWLRIMLHMLAQLCFLAVRCVDGGMTLQL